MEKHWIHTTKGTLAIMTIEVVEILCGGKFEISEWREATSEELAKAGIEVLEDGTVQEIEQSKKAEKEVAKPEKVTAVKNQTLATTSAPVQEIEQSKKAEKEESGQDLTIDEAKKA